MSENNSVVPMDIRQTLHEIATMMQPTEIVRKSLDIAGKLNIMNPIRIQDVARASGFSDQEIRTMDMFIDATCNCRWIYLSPYLIKTYLVGGHAKSIVSEFYSRILTYYQIGIDYRVLDPSNLEDKELIERHDRIFGFGTTKPKELSAERRGGSNKHYYAVSWKCYQMMLMRTNSEQGKLSREYHVKMSELVPIYNQLLNFSQIIILKQHMIIQQTMQLQSESEKRLIMANAQREREEAATAIAAAAAREEQIRREREEAEARATTAAREVAMLQRRQVRMKALCFPTIPPDTSAYFYIGTSPSMAAQHHYKIGHSSCLGTRLECYQTGRPTSDAFYFAYIRGCAHAYAVEKQIKIILKPFQEGRADSEIVIMRFDFLRRVIDAIIDGTIGAEGALREYAAVRDAICGDEDPHVPAPIELPTPVPVAPREPVAPPEGPEDVRRRLLPQILAIFRSDPGVASSSASAQSGMKEIDENDAAITALIASLHADRRAIRALNLAQRRTVKTLIMRILERSGYELIIHKVRNASGVCTKKFTLHVRAQT